MYCVLFIFILFYCPVLAVSKNMLLHVQTAAVDVQTRIVGVKKRPTEVEIECQSVDLLQLLSAR